MSTGSSAVRCPLTGALGLSLPVRGVVLSWRPLNLVCTGRLLIAGFGPCPLPVPLATRDLRNGARVQYSPPVCSQVPGGP